MYSSPEEYGDAFRKVYFLVVIGSVFVLPFVLTVAFYCRIMHTLLWSQYWGVAQGTGEGATMCRGCGRGCGRSWSRGRSSRWGSSRVEMTDMLNSRDEMRRGRQSSVVEDGRPRQEEIQAKETNDGLLRGE